VAYFPPGLGFSAFPTIGPIWKAGSPAASFCRGLPLLFLGPPSAALPGTGMRKTVGAAGFFP